MHEKIRPIHISLHQGLVLLRISTPYNQVILTRYKPNELFKPEYFALYTSNLALFKFFIVPSCRFFGLLDRHTCSVLRLDFLCVGLFSNLKVLFDV